MYCLGRNTPQAIETLLAYAIEHNLMVKQDECYARNRLLNLLQVEGYHDTAMKMSYTHVEDLLLVITNDAIKNGIIANTQQERDNFDCSIMDCVMKRPSEVIEAFNNAINIKAATKNFYDFSQYSNYIRTKRISKNVSYQVKTVYGVMDISINCSKPEKDPKDIARAKKATQSAYPTCVLCKENEGFYGNVSRDGRSNIRLIPLTLQNKTWYLQYSPYVYYNEHCIVLSEEHVPMLTNEKTFARLLEFVDLIPHYFIGANADLPIVGGSILSHDHYQGGDHIFAMAKAAVISTYDTFEHLGIKVERLHWPLSVLRLSGTDKVALIKASVQILATWRTYSDESCQIIAHTDQEHNTISTIARKVNDVFEMDLILRNNRTSSEYPFGIFHPHEEIHHIKKENIGIIEVMGLAVLPARLKAELQYIKQYLLTDINKHEKELVQHTDWINSLKQRFTFTEENVDEILYQDIGMIFVKGLQHCGVFKLDDKGAKGLDRFMSVVKEEIIHGE